VRFPCKSSSLKKKKKCAFFAATTSTGRACHYFAFRHFNGRWHILDSMLSGPLMLSQRSHPARRRGPFRLFYAHPIPYPVNPSSYHRPLARISSAPGAPQAPNPQPPMAPSRADAAPSWRHGPRPPPSPSLPATPAPRVTRRTALASLPQAAVLSDAVQRFVLAAVASSGEAASTAANAQRITAAIMHQRAADWAPRCPDPSSALDPALVADIRSYVEDDFVRNNRSSRRPMLNRVALQGYVPSSGSDSSAPPSLDGDSARGPGRPARKQRVSGPRASGPAP
jgi:hypothetical protein